MADLWEKQGMCHPSTKFPWLILALAILAGPASMCINSYQAEGGACLKTYIVGMILMMVTVWGRVFWWILGVPLLIGTITWGVGVWHGYAVMQKSK